MKIDFFCDGTEYIFRALPPIRFAIELERAGVAYKKLSLDASDRQNSGEVLTEEEIKDVYEADLSYRKMMTRALELILRDETDEKAVDFAGKIEIGSSDFYSELFLLEAIALGRIRDGEAIRLYRESTRKNGKSGQSKDADNVSKKKEKKSGSSCRAHDSDEPSV